MSRILLIGVALIGLVGLSGCGKSYDDFVDVNTRYIDAMDDYTTDLEKAGDAEAVAKAVDRYADQMAEIIPEMKKLNEKYADWRDETKMPEELKPLSEKAEKVAEKIPQTFMKLMPYIQNPEVMAAMERLQQAMAKME